MEPEINLNDEDTNYMYGFIKKITDEVGPRIPGSEQEAAAAEMIKKEMEKTCDEVEIEEFKFHPRAFFGWIRLDIVLIVISMGIYFLKRLTNSLAVQLVLSLVSAALVSMALVFMWYEFFNYDEFLDRFYKEDSSQNVIGKIKPTGEVKHIIIYSGHHDSAWQFNLMRYLKYGYGVVSFWGIFAMIFWFGVTLFNIFFVAIGNETLMDTVALWTVIIGSPAICALWFFVSGGDKGNKVPGAVDNLSAVAVTLQVGRYLKRHPELIPENTEIRLISFGCEEAGLRGAYRYVERHYDELKKYDAVNINMDGIQDPEHFDIMENEPTTRTRHSPEVVKQLLDANDLVGGEIREFGASILAKIAGALSGGTDAAAFSKAGIKAACIEGMNFMRVMDFYHQPFDTVDKIESGALEKAARILLAYLVIEKRKNH